MIAASADAGRIRCIRYDYHHESDEIMADVCDRIGIGSVLAIPVVYDRSTIAWVAVLSRQSRAFNDEAATTLELMASLLGASLTQAQAAELRLAALAERGRDQAERRERESHFRAAMDASLDAVVVLTAVRNELGVVFDFAVADANHRGEDVCALPHDAFTGLRLAALPAASAELPPVATMARVVETLAGIEHAREVVDDSGASRQVQEQIVPFGDGVVVTRRGSIPDVHG
jgi:PAS domain-containing protein